MSESVVLTVFCGKRNSKGALVGKSGIKVSATGLGNVETDDNGNANLTFDHNREVTIYVDGVGVTKGRPHSLESPIQCEV